MDLLSVTYMDNTLQNYLITGGIILLALLIGKSFKWLMKNILLRFIQKSETKLDDIIWEKLEGNLAFLIVLFGIKIGMAQLVLSDSITRSIDIGLYVLMTFTVAHGLSRLIDSLIAEYLVPLTQRSKNETGAQFLPVVRKTLQFAIWIVASIMMMNRAGYNVTSLLAGLGLGGLAFAMASKDYISNIFGGMTVFMDQTFKIKERVRIGAHDGTIEEIGLRSTRLKTFDGTIVTIPNSQFTGSMVENVSRAPAKKVAMNLGITYETPIARIKKLQKILEDIAIKNEHVKDNTIISFNNFGDFALNIYYAFYVKKSADYFKTVNEMHLAVLHECNKAKIDFAYPTQTIIKK